ncbi:MAG TPA: peptidase MA family metallohydrolase [Desulfomonilia bacterium]|nr:peptidase MA family metallohydrolase [Desulfomonilia bacterium]
MIRPVYAGQIEALNNKDVAIFYERSLGDAAHEIAGFYPSVREELEAALGFHVDFRPAVLVVSDEAAFEQIVGNRLIVAYAVPEKMLIVIDYARSSKDPFSTRTILKHELSHLLLHRYIHTIPRWLDEGVCQWVSGGFAELISEKRESYLRWASISGGLIGMNALDASFPQDEHGLVLAYEESRSFVDYIAARYGRNGITNILTALRNGKSPQDAITMALGLELPEVEREWRKSLSTWAALLAFVASDIYGVIFFLAALFTVTGYVRYRLRKRRLMDEDDIHPGIP